VIKAFKNDKEEPSLMPKAKKKLNHLKELNPVIQVCSLCGKVDAFKNDGHICDKEFRERR
jgi:recombinational DNA repair protein RecR